MKRKGTLSILLGMILILSAFAIFAYNIYENEHAKQQNDTILNQIEEKQTEDLTALYRQYPDIPMPVVEIDGLHYIGTLEAPTVDLKTPILSVYDAKTMEVTPALYSGSAYLHDMLLLGHNYQSCFGKLANLKIGDELKFIDNHKNQFHYVVHDIFIAQEDEFERIQSKEEPWDLTMFTCTWSGFERVVIRCTLMKDIPAMMQQ